MTVVERDRLPAGRRRRRASAFFGALMPSPPRPRPLTSAPPS